MKLENAIAHLDEYGYVVLKEALSPEQANALRDRSTELAAEEKAGSGEHVYFDGQAQRVWNLVNRAGFTRR